MDGEQSGNTRQSSYVTLKKNSSLRLHHVTKNKIAIFYAGQNNLKMENHWFLDN